MWLTNRTKNVYSVCYHANHPAPPYYYPQRGQTSILLLTRNRIESENTRHDDRLVNDGCKYHHLGSVERSTRNSHFRMSGVGDDLLTGKQVAQRVCKRRLGPGTRRTESIGEVCVCIATFRDQTVLRFGLKTPPVKV